MHDKILVIFSSTLAIIIIIILTIILTNFYFNPKLYQGCLNACKENNSCLEEAIDAQHERLGMAATPCIKMSGASCQLICIEKYK